jgi:hypothetical protein
MSRPTLNAPRSVGTEARLLLLAAAINAALFAIAFSCLTLGFDTNDDVGMTSIVSGVATGAPSADMVFSNILIGRVLQQFYQWTDRLNWYTAYLLAVHVATMTGLLYAFLRMQPSRTSVALFVIVFAQFEVALIQYLQFTSTAAMAGVVGLLLVLVSTTECGGKSLLAAVYGGMLIVLAGMIRTESMYYALALLVPLVAYDTVIRRRWAAVVRIGICLGIAFVPIAYDRWHYERDPRWRSFEEYNYTRALLHGAPIVDYEEHSRFFFDRVGWSETDWNMFENYWFFVDPKIYSFEHLKTILDRFQGTNWSRTDSSAYREQRLAKVSTVRALMYANVLLAILLARGARLRVFLIGLAQCLFVEMLLVEWSLYVRLVGRVIVPAFFATTVILFFIERRAAGERRFLITLPTRTSVRRLSAAAAVVFCLFYAPLCYQVTAGHLMASDYFCGFQRAFRTFVRNVDSRYVAKNPNALFVNWGAVLPTHLISPFDDFRSMRRLPMISLGWWTRSPPCDDLFRRLGISNLYREVYENPNIYLFASATELKFLSQFAWEHYRERIAVKQHDVFLVDADSDVTCRLGTYNVYHLTAAPGSPDRLIEKNVMPRLGTPGELP